MKIDNIIENGVHVEVKIFEEEELNIKTENDVKEFFDLQEKEGFCFLKCFRENEKTQTLFISEEDYKRIVNENTYPQLFS